MATRPPLLPEWASDLTQVVQPPEGRKDTGFAPGEEPPAGWINWIWNLDYLWIQYLRDTLDEIAVELGGTDADDLTTLLDQGTFTPEFATTFGTPPTYSQAEGYYTRVGRLVTTQIQLAFENNDAAFDATAIRITPPFEISDPSGGAVGLGGTGSLDYGFTSFNSDNANFTVVTPNADAGVSGIVFRGRPGALNTAAANVVYGNDPRQVRFSLSYYTTGVFNY